MSLLLDALTKVEKAKETQPDILTPRPEDAAHLASGNDDQQELLWSDITNPEEPKTVVQTTAGSSLKEWDDDLLPEFQEGNSQPETTRHDSKSLSESLAVNGNSGEPFSRFQNNESKQEPAASHWHEELITQYDDETAARISVNPVVIQSGSEPLENDSSINPHEEQLFDHKKNADVERAQSTANNPNPTFDQSFDSSPVESVVEQLSELALNDKQPAEFKADVTLQKTDEERLNFDTVAASPQPEDARRILAASAPPAASKRTLFLSGLLGVLLVGMGIGYYYYSQSSFAEKPSFKWKRIQTSAQSDASPVPASQSPTADQKQPSTSLKAAQEMTDEQSQPVATMETDQSSAGQAGFLSTAAFQMATPMEKRVDLPTEAPTQYQAASKAHSDDKSAPTSQHQPASSVISRQQQTTPKPQKVVSKAKTAAKASKPLKKQGIHTLRKNITPRINPELSKGYAAFQRGDNQAAQSAYTNALKQDKNNRDALLGLAATAWQSGNVHIAQQYYQRVLQLYPQDTHAQVGLINTLDNRSLNSESQLKLLKEQMPESAYIHFSLGNFYASLGQWAQAQQAYFEALRYDNNQADYAYNLAVSLDQMNQPRVALSYYQKAIQLAQNKPIHFNLPAAQKRVQTLRSHTRASALANLPSQNF